jgi:hypothetical protein
MAGHVRGELGSLAIRQKASPDGEARGLH